MNIKEEEQVHSPSNSKGKSELFNLTIDSLQEKQ